MTLLTKSSVKVVVHHILKKSSLQISETSAVPPLWLLLPDIALGIVGRLVQIFA